MTIGCNPDGHQKSSMTCKFKLVLCRLYEKPIEGCLGKKAYTDKKQPSINPLLLLWASRFGLQHSKLIMA
jgi:hypothetical protein